MDKGRAFDNIFIERVWRSVNYENVYIDDYGNAPDFVNGLNDYFRLYIDRNLSRCWVTERQGRDIWDKTM